MPIGTKYTNMRPVMSLTCMEVEIEQQDRMIREIFLPCRVI